MINKNKLNYKFFNDWVLNSIDDYTHRYEVYYGGGGSGKSVGAVQKIVLKAKLNPRKILVVRKVASTLRDSIYTVVKNILSQSKTNFIENKTNMTLSLENGSVFIFKGMDNPEKIKSIADITDVVIEEATELTLDDFTQLDIRLRPNDTAFPQIYLMFNPVSKVNWVYEHWFLHPPVNALVIQSSYLDNKFLSDEYRATLENLKNTNPAYYKIYCLGEFATLDKLVFPIWEKRLISDEEVAGGRFFAGMDFGFTNDPTAIVWGMYKDKTIYVRGCYYRKEMSNDDIIETVKSLGLAKEIITCDSANPKDIRYLKERTIRARAAAKGKDSIIHGLTWIGSQDIVIDERCVDLIEEFENYTWVKDKETGEYINEPIDCFNHGIDALRYATEKLQKENTISFLK